MKRPRGGNVPPMVTPLFDQDMLDSGGLERLVERHIDGGCGGITDEAPGANGGVVSGFRG